MNRKEADIKVREFAGLDFNGWAYDLFRPEQPYAARGVHPLGNGINRYRATRDLSADQLDYLKDQGKLQFLNFFSPMIFGIRSISLGKNGLSGNFAVRHLLTSFGNDISFNVYLKNKWHRAGLAYHRYENYNKGFSSLEGSLVDEPVRLNNKNTLLFSPTILIGMQPFQQEFLTSKAQLIGFAGLRTNLLHLSYKCSPYIEIDAKTSGWIAGNEFIDQMLAARFGFAVKLK